MNHHTSSNDPAGSHSPGIVYLSNIAPTEQSCVVLHRHLQSSQPQFVVDVLSPQLENGNPWVLVRRAAALLARLGLEALGESIHSWIAGRWADTWIDKALAGRQNVIILTIAHGDLAYAAQRAARRTGFPLVVIFHDWWPAMPPLGPAARRVEERRFLKLHQDAAVSFPVSEGMLQALGGGAFTRRLYPIPDRDIAAPPPPAPVLKGADPFRVLYAGNLFHYGKMIELALRHFQNAPELRLEVRGGQPNWAPSFRQEMQASHCWLPFCSRQELELWLETAHAYLIAMVFDPAQQRRMETSFPSKLTEFSRYGRPLVVWAPEYCSAILWARETGAAVCVTDPNPAALRQALQQLASDQDQYAEMGRRARAAYEKHFHPEVLQRIFEEGVLEALRVSQLATALRPSV